MLQNDLPNTHWSFFVVVVKGQLSFSFYENSIDESSLIILSHLLGETIGMSQCVFLYNLKTKVVTRPVLGEQKTSQKDQEIVNLRSTCHLAMDRCERDSNCRYVAYQCNQE